MICIVNSGTSWLNEIQHCVSLQKHTFEVVGLEGLLELNFEKYSGIIVSGADILLTQIDLPKYLNLFSFIKRESVPILGVCLGHQLMGLLYGAKIDIGKKIDREETIEIVGESTLFCDIENSSQFREEHSEFITLPNEFDLIAKSGSCENEAMAHKTKMKFGVQFHPEVSGDSGKQLFRNFLTMCSK